MAKKSRQGELEDPLVPAVVRTEDGGWEVRATRYTAVIGPRLHKRTKAMPDTPTKLTSPDQIGEAVRIWGDWLAEEHALATGKKKKK